MRFPGLFLKKKNLFFLIFWNDILSWLWRHFLSFWLDFPTKFSRFLKYLVVWARCIFFIRTTYYSCCLISVLACVFYRNLLVLSCSNTLSGRPCRCWLSVAKPSTMPSCKTTSCSRWSSAANTAFRLRRWYPASIESTATSTSSWQRWLPTRECCRFFIHPSAVENFRSSVYIKKILISSPSCSSVKYVIVDISCSTKSDEFGIIVDHWIQNIQYISGRHNQLFC